MLLPRIPPLALAGGLFTLLAYYAGHLQLIYPITSVIIGVIVLFLVWKHFPKTNETHQPQLSRAFWLITGGIALLLITSMPNGIIASTCSDLNNHARAIRLGTFTHSIFTNDLDMNPSLSSLLPLHEAPIIGLSPYIALNSIFYSTYPIASLFSGLLILLSIIGIYFLARQWFDEKTSLISFFLAGFSIVNFYLLTHGFIPQIVGSFATIWAAYFWVRNEWQAAAIMTAASMAYPPLFMVLLVFAAFQIAVQWIKNKKIIDWNAVKIIFGAAILTLPEVIELGLGRLPTFIKQGGLELIRGGIAVPNPILLIAFLPAIFGILILHREKKLTHPLVLFTLAVGVGMSYVIGGFILNYFTQTLSIQIHRLYMAVKFFYFIIWPLSIIAAIGFVKLLESKKKFVKPVTIILLTIHLILAIGFIFSLPYPQENFPAEIYGLSDKLSTLPGPFTIGVDNSLLVNEYRAPFPYNPFIDNPDNGSGKCPKIEINRMFEFPWARHELDWDDAYFRAVDDQNNWIVKYGDMNTDYYVTSQLLSFPVVFSEGNYFVYELNTRNNGARNQP